MTFPDATNRGTATREILRKRRGLLAPLFVGGVVLTAQVWHLFVLDVGPLRILMVDFLLAAGIGWWLVSGLQRGLLVGPHLKIGIFLWFIFFMILVAQSFRADDPVDAASLVVQVIRGLAAMVTLATLSGGAGRLKDINVAVFAVGAVSATVGFFIFLTKLPYIFGSRDTFGYYAGLDLHPANIYELSYGRVVQFEGFAQDPNTFAVLYAVSLLVGLSVATTSRLTSLLKYAGILVIALALIATLSRGFGASVVLVLVISLLLPLVTPHKVITNSGITLVFVFFVTGTLAAGSLIAGSQLGLAGKIDLASYIENLEDKLSGNTERRIIYQSDLLDQANESPLFGHGTRAAEVEFGGSVVENGYLALYYDLGLFGLIAYALLVLHALILGIARSDRQALIVPWIIALLLLLLQNIFTNFVFFVHAWILIGILYSVDTEESQEGVRTPGHRLVRNGMLRNPGR